MEKLKETKRYIYYKDCIYSKMCYKMLRVYCTKIKGPCQVEFARRNYRVSEYVYTYNYHLTGLPKQEHDEEIDCWGVLYKKHETQYDYENKKLIDRSHLDETSVYRYKRTRHENNKWNVFTRLEKLN